MRSSKLSVAATLIVIADLAFAQTVLAPAPNRTVYPGDVIAGSMLQDIPVEIGDGSEIALDKTDVIGRVARRTLFAGRTVAKNAIEDAHAIRNGGLVQLIYEQPGISISASGQALQAARVGDSIRVRNVESGYVVSGVVAASGVVRVNR